MMSLDTLLEHLDAGQPLVTGTEAFDCMHGYSYEAMRLTAELNNAFHTPEEIREIMGRITGRPIDETFRPAVLYRLRQKYPHRAPCFHQCLLLFPGSGRDQHR